MEVDSISAREGCQPCSCIKTTNQEGDVVVRSLATSVERGLVAFPFPEHKACSKISLGYAQKAFHKACSKISLSYAQKPLSFTL